MIQNWWRKKLNISIEQLKFHYSKYDTLWASTQFFQRVPFGAISFNPSKPLIIVPTSATVRWGLHIHLKQEKYHLEHWKKGRWDQSEKSLLKPSGKQLFSLFWVLGEPMVFTDSFQPEFFRLREIPTRCTSNVSYSKFGESNLITDHLPERLDMSANSSFRTKKTKQVVEL